MTYMYVPLFLCICQLSAARDKTLEGLNQPVDYRELKGEDPSMVELVTKMEQVHKNTSQCHFISRTLKAVLQVCSYSRVSLCVCTRSSR